MRDYLTLLLAKPRYWKFYPIMTVGAGMASGYHFGTGDWVWGVIFLATATYSTLTLIPHLQGRTRRG